MDAESPITIWAVIGVVLIIAETVIPGGIVMFLGAAALLVSGTLMLGIIDTWPQSITLWFILSIILVLSFRQVVQRFVGGDVSINNTDEDVDNFGKIADVIDNIGPGEKAGRVEFQGSVWPALGNGKLIESGTRVRVICHENISLVVEPVKSDIVNMDEKE